MLCSRVSAPRETGSHRSRTVSLGVAKVVSAVAQHRRGRAHIPPHRQADPERSYGNAAETSHHRY
jgi:hypothetical protein